MFGSVAINNIIAKYSARFEPNPEGEGYLFFKDDYGTGVSCSTEQYQDYVQEFESFVASRLRLMWLWFFVFILLSIAGIILAIYFWGIDSINEDKIPSYVGGIVMLLPLLVFFIQGWKLYQKPARELAGDTLNVSQRKQSSSEIRKRRLKGMSVNMILIGLFFPALGLYFSFTETTGVYESPFTKYLFAAVLFAFILLAWGKYKAHREDDAVLQAQQEQEVFTTLKVVQDAYLKLTDLTLHNYDPVELKKIIQQVPVVDADNIYDAIAYFYRVLDALDEAGIDFFILGVDWKEAVSDFHWKIKSALEKRGFNLSLQDVAKYPENASVGYKNVFLDTSNALAKSGLQLCFIDDGSDTYHAILFEQKNRATLHQLLQPTLLPVLFGVP